MIIREANKNDLNEILQLYLYLHEESIPTDTEELQKTWKSIIIVFSVTSYFATNPYMNTFMMSFGLVQSHFAIPIPGVIIIAIAMISISFVFSLLQARRVKKIEPYQMLIEE